MQRAVGRKDPSLPYDFQPDADRGQYHGGETKEHLHPIMGRRSLKRIKKPDRSIHQIPEDEDRDYLQHVFPLKILPENKCLEDDEQQVEPPGKSPDGYLRPTKAQDGRNAGKRGNAQVGLDGKAYAKGHHNETQRGDSVTDEDALRFHITIRCCPRNYGKQKGGPSAGPDANIPSNASHRGRGARPSPCGFASPDRF